MWSFYNHSSHGICSFAFTATRHSVVNLKSLKLLIRLEKFYFFYSFFLSHSSLTILSQSCCPLCVSCCASRPFNSVRTRPFLLFQTCAQLKSAPETEPHGNLKSFLFQKNNYLPSNHRLDRLNQLPPVRRDCQQKSVFQHRPIRL